MADASHLERMGRELKCPICLSLLDTAASLTCNHVFCNSCIHKSMKSSSNCPVCKMPYQRREIRPAPHMDNLVKIYKSMEVASGLSLFVTQHPAATKCLGAEKQTESDGDVAEEESGLNTPKTAKHQVTEDPWSKKLSKSKPKNSHRNKGKPSFLTNKRVQVPQSPISTETPVCQAKKELGKSKTINELMSNCSSSPNGQQLANGNRSLNLSPFFWLRDDEDVEKPSQQIEMDYLTGTPAKAPSFSDIKDSDDDVPSKMSPKEGILRRCNNADLFDSEMFEWTQRPCSPELCSSPVKLQVGDIGEHNRRLENFEELLEGAVANNEVTTDHLGNVSSMENNNTQHVEPHSSSSPQSKSDHKQNDSVIPCKRGRQASTRSNAKRRKKKVGQVRDAPNGSELALGSSKDNRSPKARCVQSPDSALPDEVNDLVSELPASHRKSGINEDKKLKKSKKKFKSIGQSSRFGRVKGNENKQNLMMPGIIDEAIVPHDRRRKDTQSKSYLSTPMSDKKSCCPKRRTTNCAANHQKKRYCRQMRCEIKDKVSKDHFCGEKFERNGDVHAEAAEQADGNNDQGVPGSNHLEGSSTKGDGHPQKDMPILHKCDARSTKCAFCHSTEETEASGEMVHYSEGRPVSENHSAGSVIHSHRNCTEWAPNVYFENDIAVNLEEELARSRRIKCSLCGMKGAALGCYEKSCRKSFHVPCAKKLEECRWDNEHFVILCPLHASSKLPCELSTSQPTKVKSNQKGKNLQRQSQLAVNHGTNRNLKNFDRSSKKVVLCFSGLSTTEKETVSEFAKASGALVSTTWNSAVTHVIASVDKNEAFRRTLKVLMGILEGKWILSIKWVEACMKAVALVDEAPYEISCDIHRVKNGPRLGRLRHQNKQLKLFAGFKFYLSGDFTPSYKGYLQDLLIAAGGTILHRKPVAESNSTAACVPQTIIIYSVELPEKYDVKKKDMILARRRSDAEALASSTGSKVVDNLWVLNCIAGHKLQDL